MVLTLSFQIWGLLLKERICSPREQMLFFKSNPNADGDGLSEEGHRLRQSHENVHPFPSRTE